MPTVPISVALPDGDAAPASRTVLDCLVAHGAVASPRPAYLLLVTEADRPRIVGAAGGGQRDAGKEPTWLPGGVPDRRQVESLAMVLLRAGTGEEVFRLVVSERYRPRTGRAIPDLPAAACANLIAPAPSASAAK